MKIFTKIIISLSLICSLSIVALQPVHAETQEQESNIVNVYLFSSNTCPHCKAAKEYINNLAKSNKQINFYNIVVTDQIQNITLYEKALKALDYKTSQIPLVVIGENIIEGYNTNRSTGTQIEKYIEICQYEGCNDPLYDALSEQVEITNKSGTTFYLKVERDTSQIIDLPIVGKIDTNSYPLLLLTIIIAAFDGFNPCAMWVLIFLITLLLDIKESKKRWILGSVFIFVSGLVYYGFLNAWLSINKYLEFLKWLQILIGIIAIYSGITSLKDYFKNEISCKAMPTKQKKFVFGKLKKFVKQKNFILSIIGISLMAIIVNLVELVCSAGLPAIYTKILSLSDLSRLEYNLLLVVYITVFMLDDILVFASAMKTLKIAGTNAKYERLAKLIGGSVILILGILLIIKPEWIMLNF